MTILAFDTTHGFCSVAIERDGEILASATIEEISKQAEQLIPTIESTLSNAALSYNEITHVATTVGPGSFTGVRIGLAAAHGILLSTNAEFFGVSALEAVAWQAHKALTTEQHTQPLHIILDARRGEVFIQSFNAEHFTSTSEAQLMTYADAARYISNSTPSHLAGNGIACIKGELDKNHHLMEHITLPNATHIAQVTAHQLSHKKTGLAASPLYIRKPDAKIPTKKKF